MNIQKFFASDNCAAVHPAVMEALGTANSVGHVVSYGDDGISTDASLTISNLFGGNAGVYFVYNGTAANVVAIRSLLKPYQSVLAPITAHLNEDECGSLEAMAGIKIEHLKAEGGKIKAEDIPSMLGHVGFVHAVQPGIVSLTQSTELGQVYSIDELQRIGSVCNEHGLYLHMDGARIANAVASLMRAEDPEWASISTRTLTKRAEDILAAMTVDAGVNALSLGGTKNGLMFGEAMVLMGGAEKNKDIPYIRKQSAQLASKMRYISTQFHCLYSDGLWIQNALHANAMAQKLEEGIVRLAAQHRDVLMGSNGSRLRLLHPVEANALFVVMPAEWAEELQNLYNFYAWDSTSYRLMTSWDSSETEVNGFLTGLEKIIREEEKTRKA